MWADGPESRESRGPCRPCHVFEWCVASQKCTPGLAHNDTVIRRVWGNKMVLVPSTSYDRETPDRPTATHVQQALQYSTTQACQALFHLLQQPLVGKSPGVLCPHSFPGVSALNGPTNTGQCTSLKPISNCEYNIIQLLLRIDSRFQNTNVSSEKSRLS